MNAAPGWSRVGSSLVVRSGPWAASLSAGSRSVVVRCNGHVCAWAEWRPLTLGEGGAIQWTLCDVPGVGPVPREARARLSTLLRLAISETWGRAVDPLTVTAP